MEAGRRAGRRTRRDGGKGEVRALNKNTGVRGEKWISAGRECVGGEYMQGARLERTARWEGGAEIRFKGVGRAVAGAGRRSSAARRRGWRLRRRRQLPHASRGLAAQHLQAGAAGSSVRGVGSAAGLQTALYCGAHALNSPLLLRTRAHVSTALALGESALCVACAAAQPSPLALCYCPSCRTAPCPCPHPSPRPTHPNVPDAGLGEEQGLQLEALDHPARVAEAAAHKVDACTRRVVWVVCRAGGRALLEGGGGGLQECAGVLVVGSLQGGGIRGGGGGGGERDACTSQVTQASRTVLAGWTAGRQWGGWRQLAPAPSPATPIPPPPTTHPPTG